MKENKKGNISKLLGFAGGHKKLTVLGCTLSGVSALLSMAPYILIWFVARGIFEAMPDFSSVQNLVHFGWEALWFALASAAIYFGALMCTHLAAFRTARNMRFRAAKHLVDLPLGYFTSNQSGRLRKMIDDNAGMTETLLAHELPDSVGAVVTPVAAVALLFVFDWRMGLLCLIPIAISIATLFQMMGGKQAKFFSRYQRAVEDLSAEATEYVRGIPVVKVFQQTVYSFKSFYSSIMSYSKLASEYAMVNRTPMTAFTTVLNSTFLLLIPAGMILCGVSADGWGVLVDLVFYILFTPLCAMMINRLMYAGQASMEAAEAVYKLGQIMEEAPLPEPENPEFPKGTDVELRHVTFTYPGAEAPALSDVSFRVPGGKTVALVGPSGGGKTTAASLIPRFWDAQEGEVLVGGADVRRITTEELMDKVAFVFQDTHLFKTSILENIRAARPDATREEALRAARAAQADDILEKMPQGIDTVIGTKGVYLSGGEQQRIALARAILKDAPIVVLDEATAFADPENEALIQRAFETLTRGKTVLMIAHRLSTVRGADRIIVLKDGKKAECGSHEQLLAAGGIYAAMWKDYQTAAEWKVGKEVSA
ncbi:ABC transporter ATP-binding protein [Christensenella minuta]|uniref:ABC transporter, ATP-binding protein n=1 Tax=Christensenella minuta TaxID=626937 RepID=A0A136Q929_9FIRM|nr:ABC transporter ATP-binding protein [Christensenella minuta]AYH41431.1 ABC transporter ATP-binding protein [Christensenella minuta]KXK67089.1 ABC transporter, ATP-binding protein [Christensenella minuta]OAQ41008.1 ABC transporter ATP-binding protein [Christensenella minuta]